MREGEFHFLFFDFSALDVITGILLGAGASDDSTNGIPNARLIAFVSPTSQTTTTFPPNENTVDSSGLLLTANNGPCYSENEN